ncbi:hypothetical protein GF327_09475 [Candidatus Woesearchaeota archaeon]|nr:hypothetical protein [Candidatus Woesearchaeota archaeon]
MILIDIFRTENKLYAWLFDKDKKKNHFHECMFYPKIYVYSFFKKLKKLQKKLKFFAIDSRFENKKTIKGFKKVLAITADVKSLRKIVNDIYKEFGYSCEIYNSDIPLEEYFMFENDVFPGAEVKLKFIDGKIKAMKTDDSCFEEYSLPELKILSLDLKTEYPLRKNLDPRLSSISINKQRLTGKNEEELIDKFIQIFRRKDPDIIFTEDGNIELPYLLKKIRLHYKDFSFSRFGKDRLNVKGSSYTSYGMTIYKHNAVYLKARLHFQKKGTIYGYWNLWYPYELARVCKVTLQRINHRSVGYGVSNLQLYYAHKNNFLIPGKSSCSERWKSGKELFSADRGSLIYEPEIGFHTDIAEIDFTSLFPNIMVKHNISTETMFCRCCPENKVSGLDMNICTRKKGIIPMLLEPIIKQRNFYKKTGKENHRHRADALKGLLVTSFGYMGFRKSKFARIEAHQAIQAYSREILLRASKIAEDLGFKVVHGITDSLWVKKKDICKKDVKDLIEKVNEKIGIEIKSEGIYEWIVFLPSTANRKVPVATRYYGLFKNNEIKARGIEMRRHDTPLIIKDLQMDILKGLSDVTSYSEFIHAFKKIKKTLVKKAVQRIKKGYVDKEELAITKRISKTDYSYYTPQAVILDKLKKKGFSPNPGNYIRYLVTDKSSKYPEKRYVPATGKFRYDKKEYIRMIRRAVNNMILPFDELIDEQKTLLRYAYDNKRSETERLSVQVKERAL